MANIVGLMSGTSVDGVDAAVVSVTGAGFESQIELLAFVNYPIPPAVRDRVFELFSPETGTVDRICQLNFVLGEVFAEAAAAAVKKAGLTMADIDLIGSHGQTIYHLPAPSEVAGYRTGSTLQIGEPAVIAERTGVTTIADFRTRDIAAGGEGAPLVPLADYILFRSAGKNRCLQNIGGIGNVTVLPAGATIDDVFAFDTGPGNMVIDGVVSEITGGELTFDRDGELAAKGTVQTGLLEELMTHPFFARKPPKSTGREEFGLQFARELVSKARSAGINDEDLVVTVTAFTAESIAHHYRQFSRKLRPEEVIVSGGGSYNPTLLQMITDRLPEARVGVLEDFGLSSDAKEAVAFAILANETWHGRPGNVPGATGATRPVVLGKIVPGGRGKN